MSHRAVPSKHPWHDRFATPALSHLDALYDESKALIFQSLLDLIESRTAASPAIEWRGIAWKWTLTFRRPGEDEPWAYIVPAAEAPILAMPLPAAPLTPAAARKLPRFIRDTLVHAPRVGQVRWAEWPIQAHTQLADLERFITQVTEHQPA